MENAIETVETEGLNKHDYFEHEDWCNMSNSGGDPFHPLCKQISWNRDLAVGAAYIFMDRNSWANIGGDCPECGDENDNEYNYNDESMNFTFTCKSCGFHFDFQEEIHKVPNGPEIDLLSRVIDDQQDHRRRLRKIHKKLETIIKHLGIVEDKEEQFKVA